jgi:competence protein ComEC
MGEPEHRRCALWKGASRPGLIANGLGFAVGVGVLFLLPSLPSFRLSVLLAALTALMAWRLPLARPLALGMMGFLLAQAQACQLLCQPFPESLVGRDLELTGRIAGLPGSAGGNEGEGRRFLFRIEGARSRGEGISFHGLVRLSWYRDTPRLVAGQRWRLVARLKPPHGFANPGGLDYEGWLFQHGIEATGYVRTSNENLLLDPGPGLYIIDRWRQWLRERIDEILKGSKGEGLVMALVLGDRSGLGPAQWEVLTRTGTSHLIAISGLHVGLVAGFLFFMTRWAWSRSARLTLMAAAPRAAAVAALAGAIGYSALAGFAVSTQRALIMLAVFFGAVLFARTIRPASGITLALVGVLILDPRSVISPGFWLSFGAVAVLLYALGGRLAAGRLWDKWGRAQWAIALGLLPLLLLLFGHVSLIAPLVNLIAVPLFALLLPAVLVASLLGLVSGLGVPLVLMSKVLEGGYGLLEVVSSWPWADATLSDRPGWVWVAAFPGVALLLAPRGLPGRWIGLVLLLPLALTPPPGLSPGEARFTLLDVGQGLAAVIRTGSHVLVYDTGPAFPSGFNTGAAVVLPYLRKQGVGRIDTLIISHGDRDHAGGFAGLNGRIPIARILVGEPREIPGVTVAPCLAGEHWTWDGVDFEILYPEVSGREDNESSCVLRVSSKGASVLLTGDVEVATEDELVRQQPGRLESTVLVAGHHGSNSSSSATFLQAVAPRFVLYSSGYANRFGFPAVEVRDRVAALGAVQLGTASSGAISFRLYSRGIAGPRMYRREHERLWSHRLRAAGASF